MSPRDDDPSRIGAPSPDASRPEATEDEDREAILARRARFVATALIGMTVLPACDPFPRPCLEAQPVVTSSAPPGEDPGPPPMPCLTPVSPPPPSTSREEPDAGAPPQPCLKVKAPPDPSSSAPDAGPPPPPPPPQPCLTPRRTPPQPAPCLSVVPPKPSSGGSQ